MLEEILIPLVSANQRAHVPDTVIKNMVKERMQYPVLEYVYSQPSSQHLVFYGGSCLRICFDGPRLSEDLDFTVSTPSSAIDLHALAGGLEERFRSQFLIEAHAKVQQSDHMKRVTLKFPILKKLGLASAHPSESDLLHVKIEVSDSPATPADFDGIQTTAVVKHGFSFLVKHFTLPALMAGKIHALLTRVWFKGEGSTIDIKGRDFFDLFWFFDRKIDPDWKMLEQAVGISTRKELSKMLWEKIEESVTSEKLVYDLGNFFAEQQFVQDFAKHYKEIMKKYLI